MPPKKKADTATKAKAKKKAEPVVEEELELEEVEGEEVEESGSKKSGDDVIFGASDLAAHLTEKHGKKVTARELRTLIRKMARDGSGRVDREIVPGNRTRYSWSGLDDPEVQAIIAAYEGGELEADKQAKLAELKEKKAKKKAEKDKGKDKGKGKKSKKAEEADEDEELELDED